MKKCAVYQNDIKSVQMSLHQIKRHPPILVRPVIAIKLSRHSEIFKKTILERVCIQVGLLILDHIKNLSCNARSISCVNH